VIEVVLDAEVAWSPGRLRVVGADGVLHTPAALDGTTRAGTLQAGQTLRVVIPWLGPDPESIEASDLILEIA
jgi:hypothetical protein